VKVTKQVKTNVDVGLVRYSNSRRSASTPPKIDANEFFRNIAENVTMKFNAERSTTSRSSKGLRLALVVGLVLLLYVGQGGQLRRVEKLSDGAM
jgi:hypothetical protein